MHLHTIDKVILHLLLCTSCKLTSKTSISKVKPGSWLENTCMRRLQLLGKFLPHVRAENTFCFSYCIFLSISRQLDTAMHADTLSARTSNDTVKYLTFLKWRRRYQWRILASTCTWLQNISYFKKECKELDEELAQRTFLQGNKCWFLLLCFWVVIKWWATSVGEVIWWIKRWVRWLKQEVKRSLFVQLHGSEGQVFCLLEEKHQHFTAYEQATGPPSWMSGEDLESQNKKEG